MKYEIRNPIKVYQKEEYPNSPQRLFTTTEKGYKFFFGGERDIIIYMYIYVNDFCMFN